MEAVFAAHSCNGQKYKESLNKYICAGPKQCDCLNMCGDFESQKPGFFLSLFFVLIDEEVLSNKVSGEFGKKRFEKRVLAV